VPRPFERLHSGHEATHTSRLEWQRLENGDLLSAAEQAGFQALITGDRSMQYQQSMAGRHIAVIYLRVPKNDIGRLRAMVEMVDLRLANLQPGEVSILNHPEMR
jgi:hypothetical protein